MPQMRRTITRRGPLLRTLLVPRVLGNACRSLQDRHGEHGGDDAGHSDRPQNVRAQEREELRVKHPKKRLTDLGALLAPGTPPAARKTDGKAAEGSRKTSAGEIRARRAARKPPAASHEPIAGDFEPEIVPTAAIVLVEQAPRAAIERRTIDESPTNRSGAADDDGIVRIWLRSHRSPNTRDAYARDVAGLLAFLADRERSIRSATVDDVSSWAEALAGVDATRARRISAIKSLLTFAHSTGYTQFNVGSVVRPPRLHDHLAERILSEEETFAIMRAAKDVPHGEIIGFIYATGARVSEACGLRWRHVHVQKDGSASVTLHGKGDKTRHVVLPKAYFAPIKSLRGAAEDDDPVFSARKGKQLARSTAWKILRAACEAAGIDKDVSPHWMRHANASHALDRGAPVALVRESLGHKSLETTGRYVHARANDGTGNYLKGPR